jgi:excisionase family DNA binding protein
MDEHQQQLVQQAVQEALKQAVRDGLVTRPSGDHYPEPEYLDTAQAAAYLGLSRQYLEIARHKGEGPPFVKLPKAVRYSRRDLDAWMRQRRQPTADAPEAA